MSNICCLLDACTVINLIHIDEDDFILKKLKETLDIHLNEIVFKEIQKNVYTRLEVSNINKNSDKNESKRRRKIVEEKLSFFRSKKNDNTELEKELGGNFFERIRTFTDYHKFNGELYSTAQALYMSRSDNKKVFFYTDDLPAKDFFAPFFNFQQIGHIKDSVDLIILLYWLDDKFTDAQLRKALSELYSQYVTDVRLLEKSLEGFRREKIDAAFTRKNKDVSENLKILIHKLKKLEFRGINKIKAFYENKKAKQREIYAILEKFPSVFELDTDIEEQNLINKIRIILSQLESKRIYKLLDLCA